MRLLFVTTLSTTASGFMVPTVPVNVEQLVEKLPQMNDEPATPWLDFTAKSALIPFIIYAPFANAKATETSTNWLPIPTEDEIDYDAPLERQMKVDHIVRRQPFTLGLGEVGTITPPAFIQQAFDLYKPEHCFELSSDDMDEYYLSLVHDECYLGKDCTAKECVDFDPLHVHREAPFHFMTPPLAGGY
mmetsp:Transcript_19776/g.28175  ORF Transcript_19776/g.28175 Transcript_19776/m.28175 type:complete len:188 (-) Transcript_19776:2039-2602(-)